MEERNDKGQYVKGSPQDTNKNGTAGRPTVMDEQTISKLKMAFMMGCSDAEACLYADISKPSLYRYQEEHPEFTDQKEQWKHNPVLKARATVYKNLDKEDMARWYMERKVKTEFAPRQELTGQDGDKLFEGPVIYRPEKYTDETNSDKA